MANAPSTLTQAGSFSFRALLALMLLLASTLLAQAAGLSGAEYFIGPDPGPGQGTPLAASDGAFDTETELVQAALSVASLSNGVNRVGLRFQGPDGSWGNPLFIDIQVQDGASLTTDPPLLAQGGAAAALRTLATADFAIAGGALTTVSAADGAFDSVAEQTLAAAVFAAVLSNGVQRISLRFADSDNRWGNEAFVDVRVQDAASLVTDPPLLAQGGAAAALRNLAAGDCAWDGGLRTALVAADGAFDSTVELSAATLFDISSMSNGTHRVALRFQDSETRWGNESFVDVVVQDAASLVSDPPLLAQGGAAAALRTLAAGDCAWDNGPRTALVAADGAFDSTVELSAATPFDISSMSNGSHRVALRFQDSENRWCNESFVDILVQDAAQLATDPPLLAQGGGTAALRTLFAGEYSVDGSAGTPLAARDGAYDSATEETATALLPAASLPVGTHRLALRFQDSEQRWGNQSFIDVLVQDATGLATDPPLLSNGGAAALNHLSAADYAIDGGARTPLLAADGAFDTPVEPTLAAAISPNSLARGTHRLAVRFQDNASHWGNETFVYVTVEDASTLAVEPPLLGASGAAAALQVLAGAEFFVDQDPGPGQGTALLAADGSFDAVAESLSDTASDITPLAGGPHRVGMRFKDSAGDWGEAVYQGFAVSDQAPEPPSIAVPPPARQIVAPGELAVLSVLADGSQPLHFQWLKENVELAGATNSALYLPGVAGTDAGGYSVVITNDYGSVTSATSRLVVRGPTYAPEIVVQPASQTVMLGSAVSLGTVVDASWPVSFQWFKNGAALLQATSTNLVFTNAQLADSGTYWLLATNDFGAVTSAPAVLHVEAVMAFANGAPLLGTNTFEGEVLVSLQTAFPNGSIFYTLDGSAPDYGAVPYSGPFTVSSTCTLRAVAYDASFSQADEMLPVTLTIVPLLKLSAVTAGGGTVTLAPPGGAYRHGTVVTVSATPASGWTFMGWMGDSRSTETSLVFTMTNNRSVNAMFGTTLAMSVTGNGTVSSDPIAPLYPYGSTLRLSAVPASGSAFVTWGSAGTGTNNPLSFLIKSPNPLVTCLFAPLSSGQFALTVLPQGFGKVSTSPRGNRFTNGQPVTLTATPDPGQAFLGWSGDVVSTNSPVTVTMNSSKVIQALFTSRPVLQPDPENSHVPLDGFRLLLTGQMGARVDIHVSSDMSQWSPWVTVTNNFGMFRLLDDSAADAPVRFYRAVQE